MSTPAPPAPTSTGASADPLAAVPPSLREAAAGLRDRVLYRDGAVLVIDKPPGLPVHAGPRGGPSLEDLLPALADGRATPPRLAHRLDADTTGCLALGRNDQGLRRLNRLFAEGRAQKTYWGVVEAVGGAVPAAGLIERPLRKANARGGWRMQALMPGTTGAGVLTAATRYEVLASAGGLALVAFTPLTGRTHQIRVHAAAEGWPLLGDPLYGRVMGPALPLHLHARRLELPYWQEKPPILAQAPLPEAFAATCRQCGLAVP